MVRIPEYEEVLAWAQEMDRQVAERRIAGLGGRVAEVFLMDLYAYIRMCIYICMYACDVGRSFRPWPFRTPYNPPFSPFPPPYSSNPAEPVAGGLDEAQAPQGEGAAAGGAGDFLGWFDLCGALCWGMDAPSKLHDIYIGPKPTNKRT